MPTGLVSTGGSITVAPSAALPGETAQQTLERVAKKRLPPGATVTAVPPPSPPLSPSPPSPPTKAALIARAQRKQIQIATGSIRVNIGTSAAPLYVAAEMDALSLTWLAGAAAIAAGNSAAMLTWAQASGPVQLTAAQALTIYSAVQGFVQSTFATLGAVIAAVNAGTITTSAQIDTPPSPLPPWPVNS